jgi:two-component system chemotaxis response regulator CheB
VAQEFSVLSVGVLMTGMGEDGAEGLRAIQAAGGMTVAQSEDTCVVSGMPRAAIVKGYANKIVPLDSLGSFLMTHFGEDRAAMKQAPRIDRINRQGKEQRETDADRTTISSRRS